MTQSIAQLADYLDSIEEHEFAQDMRAGAVALAEVELVRHAYDDDRRLRAELASIETRARYGARYDARYADTRAKERIVERRAALRRYVEDYPAESASAAKHGEVIWPNATLAYPEWIPVAGRHPVRRDRGEEEDMTEHARQVAYDMSIEGAADAFTQYRRRTIDAHALDAVRETCAAKVARSIADTYSAILLWQLAQARYYLNQRRS